MIFGKSAANLHETLMVHPNRCAIHAIIGGKHPVAGKGTNYIPPKTPHRCV
jgi:hypothetical protein